jgi:hypothetical protein
MSETKVKNLKRVILLSLHKHKEEFALFDFSDVAKAHKSFLLKENLTDEQVNLGYFKYFFKQIFVENVLESPKNQIAKDLKKYLEAEAKGTANSVVKDAADEKPAIIEIKKFRPADHVVDEEMFRTYLTNSEIDEIFSDDLGVMAATSIVMTGGPGVGKSTVTFWLASRIRELYPDIEINIVSSEMEEEDILYECRRKPWMKTIDFILTSEYEDGSLDKALEKIFFEGSHIIILDSFADVCEKLKDFCGYTMSKAENFILGLMKKAKGGKNKKGIFTHTLAIQQVTKGGTFAGSNKLKHNTSGMVELRREASGDRYMVFTKNRRCGQNVGKKLYYFLGANNQIMFDHERWEREKAGDTEETPVNEAQEAMSNRLLTQFGEITGTTESLQRTRALLQQADIPEDLNLNVNLMPPVTVNDLPFGVKESDIYLDTTVNLYMCELEGKDPVFGPTKEAVIQQLVARAQLENRQTETEGQ